MFRFEEDINYLCTYCNTEGKWRLLDDTNRTILYLCQDHKRDLYNAIYKVSSVDVNAVKPH